MYYPVAKKSVPVCCEIPAGTDGDLYNFSVGNSFYVGEKSKTIGDLNIWRCII
jgi:hypothetical protein